MLLSAAPVYAAPCYESTASSLRNETGPVYLADVGQLLLQEPALKRLEVSGYGLNESEWLAFGDDIELVFKPPSLSGVADIRWPRQLLQGEALKITGRWLNPDHAAKSGQASTLKLPQQAIRGMSWPDDNTLAYSIKVESRW